MSCMSVALEAGLTPRAVTMRCITLALATTGAWSFTLGPCRTSTAWQPSRTSLKAHAVSGDAPTRPALKVVGRAGPEDQPPVYDDSGFLDRTLLSLFRSKLAAEIGEASQDDSYDGLMDMIRVLNEKYPTKRGTQEASRRVLNSLFPSWLPGAFAIMFSRPLPGFSSRMNAWVTLAASQWLMGPSEINDVEVDGGGTGRGQGLLVQRCRFLEASGCASVCMNTCKVPTEEFFIKDMGLPLEMTPNYDDFSCQFSFGKTPLPRSMDEAFQVSCFAQCPSRVTLRTKAARCHQIEVEDE